MWRVWRVELLPQWDLAQDRYDRARRKLGGQEVGGRHAGTLERGPQRLRLVALMAQPALGTKRAPLAVCRRVLEDPINLERPTMEPAPSSRLELWLSDPS